MRMFFFSAGLPVRHGDVRGGQIHGPRTPYLQREHSGHQSHRRVPQADWTQVPQGRYRYDHYYTWDLIASSFRLLFKM